MSIYDTESVQISFECSQHQKSKLKSYCKLKKVSVSMLFRLFIDELRITQMDESIRYKIQEINWKTHNLLGGDTDEPVSREGFNDENGNKKSNWFSRTFVR